MNRSILRNKLRHARRTLTAPEQECASICLAQNLQKLPIIHLAQHFALYLPNDGEINPSIFIEWLWQQKKKCYLPVLSPKNDNTLLFFEYTSKTEMIHNRFGIQEPKPCHRNPYYCGKSRYRINATNPGFTASGIRLGMGGGYYDRTFSFIGKESLSTTDQCD